MPFVHKNDQGEIDGVYTRPQPSITVEEIPEDHPDLIAWRAAKAARAAEPGEFETLMELLRDGDQAFDAKMAAAHQRIIDRRP